MLPLCALPPRPFRDSLAPRLSPVVSFPSASRAFHSVPPLSLSLSRSLSPYLSPSVCQSPFHRPHFLRHPLPIMPPSRRRHTRCSCMCVYTHALRRVFTCAHRNDYDHDTPCRRRRQRRRPRASCARPDFSVGSRCGRLNLITHHRRRLCARCCPSKCTVERTSSANAGISLPRV